MNPESERSRGGFTLLELLVTMTVLGVLAGIAVPNFRAASYRAEAAKVRTDVNAIRFAIFEFREEAGRLPRTSRWGTVPSDLVPHLENVPFEYKDLRYRVKSNSRRGRVDVLVRYPRGSPIGAAMRKFRNPGNDSGSVTWGRTRTRFRILERNQ